MHRFKPVAFAVLASGVIALSACGGGGGNASDNASGNGSSDQGTPQSGGQITVLEDSGFAGSWPAGLDPATNTNGAANQPMMDTVYGQLFKLVEGGKIDRRAGRPLVLGRQGPGQRALRENPAVVVAQGRENRRVGQEAGQECRPPRRRPSPATAAVAQIESLLCPGHQDVEGVQLVAPGGDIALLERRQRRARRQDAILEPDAED